MVGKNEPDYLKTGSKIGETLSEDHFDFLGKRFGVRVFFLQDYRGSLTVFSCGDSYSEVVKVIHSDGNHFQELVWDS